MKKYLLRKADGEFRGEYAIDAKAYPGTNIVGFEWSDKKNHAISLELDELEIDVLLGMGIEVEEVQ